MRMHIKYSDRAMSARHPYEMHGKILEGDLVDMSALEMNIVTIIVCEPSLILLKQRRFANPCPESAEPAG
jgi:hypothetical protein